MPPPAHCLLSQNIASSKKCPGAEQPQILCHPALYCINKMKTPWHKDTAGLLISQIGMKHQNRPGRAWARPIGQGWSRSKSLDLE